MTKPTIMPIGIIQQPTENGATFKLTRPRDPTILKINSSVMVRNTHWDQDEIPSGVMVRGHITEIGPTSATFTTSESWADPNWPKDTDILVPGNFVHLALPDSFEIDRSQIATRGEEKFLQKLEMDRQLKKARERKDSRLTTARPSPKPGGSEQK